MPLQPDLIRMGSSDLASRITWVQANLYDFPSCCLHTFTHQLVPGSLDGLPFPNDEFDFVLVSAKMPSPGPYLCPQAHQTNSKGSSRTQGQSSTSYVFTVVLMSLSGIPFLRSALHTLYSEVIF